MNILITLCARGGSKGVHNKNITLINGFPLVYYSIKHAQKFSERYGATIILSTDSLEIKKVAAIYGLTTDYLRPSTLATDTAGKLDTIKDVLLYEEKNKDIVFDWILDLDISSPLRTLDDLYVAFEQIRNNKDALNLFSVSDAQKNPYFNMVEKQNDGFFRICKPLPKGVISRQTAPKVFELNASFYFYRRSFFYNEDMRVINNKSLAYVMSHICFDIDEPIDMAFMKYLIEGNILDFII